MRRRLLPVVLAVAVAVGPLAGCSSGDADSDPAASESDPATAPVGRRLVDADTAASLLADAPTDLVVLDVRTPEEFAEGHIEGAVLLDFYEPDFDARLGDLDPDVPYVVICRSGNRSAQAAAMMIDLGFTDVTDVGGGIDAWVAAGHPVVTS